MASDLATVSGFTGGLGRVDLCLQFFQDANFVKFLETLPYLRQKRPARTRHDHIVRPRPAELLHDLEALRLGALCVKGPDVNVHECPAVLVGNLAAEPVHVIIAPVHGNKMRLVGQGSHNLALLKACRDEDESLEARLGTMRRDRVGKVPGGGARHRIEPELLRLGEGNGHNAVLEGERGMHHRIVLHVEFADAQFLRQVVRLHKRSEPRVQAHLGLPIDGQKFLVSPETLLPLFDDLSRKGFLDGFIIVGRLEGPKTEFAHIDGLHRVLAPTLPALQPLHMAHACTSMSKVPETRSGK
jgi:hypothetical protein